MNDIAVINYAVRTLQVARKFHPTAICLLMGRISQLDPQTAKAPIILGQEKSDDDSVVKWIREEFTELTQVCVFVMTGDITSLI